MKLKMEPWYKREEEFYRAERTLVEGKFPTLYCQEEQGRVVLVGVLPLDGTVEGLYIQDSYRVRIEFPDDYPYALPGVYEVGGRKEKVMQIWKLNNSANLHYFREGKACLCYAAAKKRYCNRNTTIETLLNELIIWFFYEQSYFEKTGKWPAGEYGHGFIGTMQFYREELQVEDNSLIISSVKFLATSDAIKADTPCLCGSRKLISKCHPSLYVRLRALRPLIDQDMAMYDLALLVQGRFEVRNLFYPERY
ncbi:MAG TPA: hypothetical protein VGK02_09280 [Candidatus Aquicultor sp.]|jgi:hypothetical protein